MISPVISARLNTMPGPIQVETGNLFLESERTTKYIPQVAQFKHTPPWGKMYPEGIPYETLIADIEDSFKQFIADKGYNPRAIAFLARSGILGNFFNNLVLRQYHAVSPPLLNNLLTKIANNKNYPLPLYHGTPQENRIIDQSIAESNNKNDLSSLKRREFSGRAASRVFHGGNISLNAAIQNVPIVILGGGPAGLMTARAFIDLGFGRKNITIIDKTGEYRGIWNQRNVREGSKNNPFLLKVNNHTLLDAAPGSGESVHSFLGELLNSDLLPLGLLPHPLPGFVTGLQAGDLAHTVSYKIGDKEETVTAPIVVNCLGNGKPASPNREGYMTTNTPHEAGIRWQQIWTPEQADRYRNKRLIFIGLGNSTAEMLIQIQKLNLKGYNIDYRVLTHYPIEAVHNPEQDVIKGGKKYRVFRDLGVQNLTRWEGDLSEARTTYFEALTNRKIITDVNHWDVEKIDGKRMISFKTHTQKTESIVFDQQFTLIGYKQDPSLLEAMGMTVIDESLGAIAYDYDGEVQRQPGMLGRDRLYPGYFANGAILRTEENPNATVIPGIMHRLYDLTFSAAVRAAEVVLASQ